MNHKERLIRIRQENHNENKWAHSPAEGVLVFIGVDTLPYNVGWDRSSKDQTSASFVDHLQGGQSVNARLLLVL